MKIGIKTSEFWVTLGVILLTTIQTSGIISPTSSTAQLIGLALTIAAAFGYTISRGIAKSGN